MQFYILNQDYEQIAIIDQTESKIWDKKFNDVGYCEIYTPCNDEMLDTLQQGYYVYRCDDDMFCQIQTIEITTDVENGDYIIATANDICNILSGRIIWDQIVFSGKVCDFIKKVLNDNVINSQFRSISNFEIDESNFSSLTDTISQTVEGNDILQFIILTCKTYNLGFRISYNINTSKLVFRLYKGENKAETTSDEYIEFSPTYSNIISSMYKEDNSNYKNVAVVGVKVNDAIIRKVSVYIGDVEPTGEERKEIYVEISNNDNDEITTAGLNALTEHNQTQEFSGDVDTTDSYNYKIDYNLGDIVKVINKYGISANAKIDEVMESEDNENGYVVEPKFIY